MALFNQQPNGFDGRRSVNTKGYQFYNAEGFGNSTLKVDLWNEAFISVHIHPARPKHEQTDKEKFDYDRQVSSAIPAIKVNELLDAVPRIIKAFEEGKDANAYVDVAGNNLVGIGTMKYNGNQIYYFAMHRNLDEDKLPEVSAYFEFPKSYRIEDYDPKTGKHGMNGISGGEFHLFVKCLEEQVRAVNKATAHSVRVAFDMVLTRLESKLDAIGKATNAKFDPVTKYGAGSTRLFGNNQTDTENMESVMREAEKAVSNKLPDLNEENSPF